MRQLYAFMYVARCGTFTDAAQQLNLTQSAVSALVRELEGILGMPLFARTTRSVTLTPTGTAFLEQATRNVRGLEEAVHHIDQLRALKSGRVTIAAPQLMACTIVPEAISRYHHEHPGIEIRVVDCLVEEAVEMIRTGDADLGIGPGRMRSPDLRAEHFVKVPTMLVCSPGLPIGEKRRSTWAEALKYPYIALKGNFTSALERELLMTMPPGFELRPILEVSYFTTVLGMLRTGKGVTSAPAYALPLVRAFGLSMVPLRKPTLAREFFVFSAPTLPLSPAALSFHDFLLQFGESAPDWHEHP